MNLEALTDAIASRLDFAALLDQDKTALAIVEEVLKDYPAANYRIEVSQALRTRSLCTRYRESDLAFVARLLAEEGLSFHFEHLDGQAAKDADSTGHARHVLVITDAAAPRPDLGDTRFTSRHVSANAFGQKACSGPTIEIGYSNPMNKSAPPQTS